MEAHRTVVARQIEKLGLSEYRSVANRNMQPCEHLVCELGSSTGFDYAFVECILLANAVSRGSQRRLPVAHHCGNLSEGPAGPRSTVRWLGMEFRDRRLPDPEATTLLLAWWARKQKANLEDTHRTSEPRTHTAATFSDIRNIPLGDHSFPVIELEEALRNPLVADFLNPSDPTLFEESIETVIKAVMAPTEDLTHHAVMNQNVIRCWGKVAPVVPLDVSIDHRTHAGWMLLARVLELAEHETERDQLLRLFKDDVVATREIKRIANHPELYESSFSFFGSVVSFDQAIESLHLQPHDWGNFA